MLSFKKAVKKLYKNGGASFLDLFLVNEFFKTGMGKHRHNVCQFYDQPKAKLRLFFIEEQHKKMIIVGGGGLKPKNAKATQDYPELNLQRELLL